ncbi:hypothetical protein [Amaricoccus solimangrovi]|uniref:Uncharacterized protein n=1 Tax=Amaricoccus solimangrovi TaxID=2589815 RepID=A0A501WY46_9RHOB|nr:hypothetical protein [Amaricoccus solimangrovi]TPE53134.1 hypothetical protein FJM51_03675 [Amaricoccus solimangrovi]
MSIRHPLIAAAVLAVSIATSAASAGSKSRYDWDALGAEFCARSLAGDLDGLRDILTPSLVEKIRAASGNPRMPAPNVLFQSYLNPVPVCEARTRNAAIVQITRSMPGGKAPAWTEYLEVVPLADGTTRIDNVLFATRRSDTLRTRLDAWAAGR